MTEWLCFNITSFNRIQFGLTIYNEANIIQKQYVQDLRDGKVGLAQALLKPQTPQRVSKNNTVNLKQFLTERGYDINRPETIPDSVLTTPVKYDAARKQARR